MVLILCTDTYKDKFKGCRDKIAEGHKVFVSEYNAPDDFVCIWQQGVKTAINQSITKDAVERLFVHKSQL